MRLLLLPDAVEEDRQVVVEVHRVQVHLQRLAERTFKSSTPTACKLWDAVQLESGLAACRGHGCHVRTLPSFVGHVLMWDVTSHFVWLPLVW